LEALSGVAKQYANAILIDIKKKQGGSEQFDIDFLMRAGTCPSEYSDILDE
jgi:hypothetical protein